MNKKKMPPPEFKYKCGNFVDLTRYSNCDKDKEIIRNRIFKAQLRDKQLGCWTERYLRHRQRVEQAISYLDANTPRCPPTLFTRNNNKFNRRIQNFVRIEAENLLLTERIKNAFLGEPLIDNYRDPFNKTRRHHGLDRLKQQLQILGRNLLFVKRLKKVTGTPQYRRCTVLNWYAKQEYYMAFMAKYPLYWRNVLCQSYEAAALTKAMEGYKPQVYFDLEVKDKQIGRIVIELEPMASPVAVECFRIMFEGKNKTHNYKCKKLEKIYPKIGWKFGSGAKSIVKAPLSPKKYRMKHDQEGIVTLLNNGHDQFEAEFLITARELKPLDGRYLAIGRVTEGMDYLESLEQYLFRDSKGFRQPMHMVRTGVYDAEKPPPDPKMTRKCPSPPKKKEEPKVEEEAQLNEDNEDNESDGFEPTAKEDEKAFQVSSMPITYEDTNQRGTVEM